VIEACDYSFVITLEEETMEQNDLRELYVDELKDLYDAENQLIKALPKMAEAATSDQLRLGFEQHLEQTREHAQRIERIFNSMGEKVKGKKCKGMKGLISEGEDVMSEDYDGELMDAALISAAQRVEHYEIAAYGTVRTFANILGEQEAVTLLEQTLEEEKQTDKKLTELAKNINFEAAGSVTSTTDTSESASRRGKAAGV
jgi:ferritin-like metal-binding protein YciE